MDNERGQTRAAHGDLGGEAFNGGNVSIDNAIDLRRLPGEVLEVKTIIAAGLAGVNVGTKCAPEQTQIEFGNGDSWYRHALRFEMEFQAKPYSTGPHWRRGS